MRITVCKKFTFDAAHHLPNHEGVCKNVHGHRYTLVVCVSAPAHEVENKKVGAAAGMVLDFGDLKAVVKGMVIDILDHSDLNDVLSNPTAENLLLWILPRLKARFAHGTLERVRLYETPDSYAEIE